MAVSVGVESMPVERHPRGRGAVSRWFVASASALILTALAIGFAPTFFLRAFFNVPPIPGYLYLHGAILTSWFVLVFVQSCLVATRRVRMHRRLGIAGVVLAVVVILSSGHANLYSVARLNALGLDRAFIEGVFTANFLSLSAFAVMIALGISMRRRPEVHKRLMLLAALTIMGPIFARYALSYGMSLPPRIDLWVLAVVAFAYDVVARQRPHPVTAWSVLGVLTLLLAGQVLLVRTGAAAVLVDAWL